MARLILGPNVLDLRGKLGEVVYQGKRGGTYAHTYVPSTNNKRTQQVAWRAALTYFAVNWSDVLNEDQRQAWRQAAKKIKRTDILGNKHTIDGFHLFTAATQYLFPLTAEQIFEYTRTPYPPDPGELTATADTSTSTITINSDVPCPADCIPVIQVTPPLTPGHNSFNRWLKVLFPSAYFEYDEPFASTTPVPPWTASPTYNPTDWISTPGQFNYTATSGQQDIRLNQPGRYNEIICHANMPDLTSTHWLVALRVDPATGAAYLYGLTPTAGGSVAIAYRATWSSSPTVIGEWAWPGASIGTHEWDVAAYGAQLRIFSPFDPGEFITDTRLPTGDLGLCPSNGPINWNYIRAYYAYPDTPDMGDISAIYLDWVYSYPTVGPPLKPVLVPGKKIGFVVRYCNLLSGEIGKAQSTFCVIT